MIGLTHDPLCACGYLYRVSYWIIRYEYLATADLELPLLRSLRWCYLKERLAVIEYLVWPGASLVAGTAPAFLWKIWGPTVYP